MTETSPASSRPSRWRHILSLLLLLPILSFSWLTVVRAPTNKLWMLAIVYTEAGYILACLLLVGCLLVDRSRSIGKWLSTAGILGIGVLLLPWAQALSLAPQVKQQLNSTFDTKGDLSQPQAPGQTKPFHWHRLVWQISPEVKRKSYTVDAPGKKLLIDVYQRRLDNKPQPLLVMIHGGAWRTGSPRMLPGIHSYLAARGVTVAAISYRFMPKHKFPTQLQDVTRCLKWLRQQAKALKIQPNRITLMGRSAGGHLALLAGYKRVVPGIRSVVNMYGPTDLHWSWKHPANPWVINSTKVLRGFLGGSPKEVKSAYDQASPIQFVTAKSPPTLMIHGTRDELVSPEHSRRLSEKLFRHGVKHMLLELPWATHGCDAFLSGPSGQLSLYVLERFLKATLLD
ncbi:MAG: alpha/beta hydrolase [Deltaproteobacteria bacterium]|nr:MAG: alpha/beta hydrolase [Deltaproteobacteria bacterium]